MGRLDPNQEPDLPYREELMRAEKDYIVYLQQDMAELSRMHERLKDDWEDEGVLIGEYRKRWQSQKEERDRLEKL
jgi:hypothetical protein